MQHPSVLFSRLERSFAQRWLLWVLLMWAAAASAFIFQRWGSIHWFALGDTDDNLRLLQVRAWLNGQDWYDLRQYKLNPPLGADIHWTRLIDLPIAALILIGRMFTTPIGAEKFAVAVAPLIPLMVAMTGVALTARRLVDPRAAALAAFLLIFCQSTMSMFMPLRIDHHGWQLAALAVMMAGLADPKQVRGGMTVGLASAVSMTIGIEMIAYLAIAGAVTALRWIVNPNERMRLRAYALSLTVGIVAGYFGFASYDNALARCDALTPVWAYTLVVAGIFLGLLSLSSARSIRGRFALATMAGAVLVAGFVLLWPQCAGRPEGVSLELNQLWLSNIREAKPLYMQSLATILPASLAALGIIGGLIAVFRARYKSAWLSIVLLSLCAGALMMWQTRASPAALMLSVPGATAFCLMIMGSLRRRLIWPATLLISALLLIFVSGIGVQIINRMMPISPPKPNMIAVNNANRQCPTLPALRPIAKLPATTIFTFVDLSPRLAAMTHHKAIAGPYHRNGEAILDVQHAFRGTADAARAIIKRHGATLLLICPNLSESTIYKVQNPDGFYAQLIGGKVPTWLDPMPLPAGSPYKLWRVR